VSFKDDGIDGHSQDAGMGEESSANEGWDRFKEQEEQFTPLGEKGAGGKDKRQVGEKERMKIAPDSYSVRRVAKMLRLPLRTVYYRVRQEQIRTKQDASHRIRIATAELEKLQQWGQDRENRSNLLGLIASRRGIKPASARRYLSRALAKRTFREITSELLTDMTGRQQE